MFPNEKKKRGYNQKNKNHATATIIKTVLAEAKQTHRPMEQN